MQTRARILIGKPGLDGHDRGAKYISHILRDAGFEVIYTGIRRSPEQIVEAAVQEDVAAVGLSLLSGAHNVLFNRVIDLLRERGAGDILVFGGGTIPPKDIPGLLEMGVAAVFTPGTPAKTIIETFNQKLATPA
jgi:methylmalonyl-CoA mutase C-terminal domain/subunit